MKNLIERSMTDAEVLAKERIRGSDGNYSFCYKSTGSIKAAFLLKSSKGVSTAEKTKLQSSYVVTVPGETELKFGDILKTADGCFYAVSGEKSLRPPKGANPDIRQYIAVSCELPGR